MRKIIVKGREITLDHSLFNFDESTLQKYIENEGGWYCYYGEALADAEAEWKDAENRYELAFQKAFQDAKEQGGSDKLAEAKAKLDTNVVAAKEIEMETKHKVRLLQQHLKSYDKNHDNAQSRGHFLRKEMDKLAGFHSDTDYDIDKVVRSADEQLRDQN